MNLVNSGYDRSNVPESSWPDGSPVSNWSKAVAKLALTGDRARVDEKSVVSIDVRLFAKAA